MKKAKDPTEPATPPAEERLLVEWLDHHPAATRMGSDVVLMTTDDIINELSDMCDLERNQVVTTMLSLGYYSYASRDGSHGWMIEYL